MFKSVEVPNWVLLVYERQQRFRPETARQMIADLVKACKEVGRAIYARSTTSAILNPGRNHDQSPACSHKMGIGPRKHQSRA